jgi:hypothetical protein
MQWLTMGCPPSQVRGMCKGAVCIACYHLGLKAALGRPTGRPWVFLCCNLCKSWHATPWAHNNAKGMPVNGLVSQF